MKNKIDSRIPKYRKLLTPIFIALKNLGGSGTNEEILNQIIKDLSIPDEVADISHLGNINQTELSYQIAWSKTYLKKGGAIQNSGYSVWSISPDYVEVESIDEKEVLNLNKKGKKSGDFSSNSDNSPEDNDITNDDEEYPEEVKPWKEKLAGILQTMNPFAFERLTQRLLRECGFTQVIVTKKSGDGGIDGTGKLKINGIFSFNVAFQCKRYKGSVGAPEIRDFRGSLTANVEKGLFITTGTFSKSAKDEACCQGKQQIDLIDGEELISLLARYQLGVHPITTYEVEEDFFKKI